MIINQKFRPFWCYYGGKAKHSGDYPSPTYDTIIEPFAGAAGYSMRHPTKHVILVEKDPRVALTWKFLLTASTDEILSIPIVTDVADLPDWVPIGARQLVGFNMNTGISTPAKTLSASHRNNRIRRGYASGWSLAHRKLCAWQSQYIQSGNWELIEGAYSKAPDIQATWFVDPPYNNAAGHQYRMHDLDYLALGEWCKSRKGQTIVCENEGADWLPFQTFKDFSPSINKGRNMCKERSREAIWINNNTTHSRILSSISSC